MRRRQIMTCVVIPDLIRDPVPRAPWIAERVRNDGNEACHAGPSGCHREPTVSGSKLQVDHEPMTRHCEECSDAAIHAFRRYGSPRPGGLAMTKVRVRFMESPARQSMTLAFLAELHRHGVPMIDLDDDELAQDMVHA